MLIGCHKVHRGVNQNIFAPCPAEEESREGPFPPERGGQSIKHLDEKLQVRVWRCIPFSLHTRKTLFDAKNVTIKVMGVIAVQFQFWFQFDRHNKTQTCPPASSLCPAVAGWSGELSVIVFTACHRSARRAGDGLDCVILEERLQKHAHRAEHAHKHKDPQEEAVDHHGNILPVLAHLWKGGGRKKGLGWSEKTTIRVILGLVHCVTSSHSLFICSSASSYAEG